MPLNLPRVVQQVLASSELFPKRKRSSLSLRRSVPQLVFLSFQVFPQLCPSMFFSPFRLPQHAGNQMFHSHPGMIGLLLQYQYGQNYPPFADHHVSLFFFFFFKCRSTLGGFVYVKTLTLQRGNSVGFIGPCSIWVCIFLFYFVLKGFFPQFLSPQKGKMYIRKCAFAGFPYFLLYHKSRI